MFIKVGASPSTLCVLQVLGVLAWSAIIALSLAWWAPSILLAVAALAADRVRFRALLARVGLLRSLGRRDAARRVLNRALRRCEARRRALAVRCSR